MLGFLLYLTNTANLWYINWIIDFWYFLKNRLIRFRVPLDFGVMAVTYKHTNLKYLEIVSIMDWIALLIYHGKDITNSQHFQNISINASPNFPNGTIEKLPVLHNFWCPPSYVGFFVSLIFIFTNIAIIIWQKFMWYKNWVKLFQITAYWKGIINTNIVQSIINNRQNFGVPPQWVMSVTFNASPFPQTTEFFSDLSHMERRYQNITRKHDFMFFEPTISCWWTFDFFGVPQDTIVTSAILEIWTTKI